MSLLCGLHSRHRKRSGKANIKEQELQGVGEIESRGKDYEMRYTPMPEKDGSSQ